jgi:hypothetical protein
MQVNKAGMKPGDYAQTEEARNLREIVLGGKGWRRCISFALTHTLTHSHRACVPLATKQGLVTMPPPVPDRRSRRSMDINPIVPSSEPLDYSKLPGMKVEEGDLDEDST